MSKKIDRPVLSRVFSDAHVIDVDLSQWDKHIEMWMLADHYADWKERCPLVIVSFNEVTVLNMSLHHYHMKLATPAHHQQWRIDDFKITENGDDTVTVHLFASTASPRLAITCASIEVREQPHSTLDELFPNWGAPYSGLARPGINELKRALRGKR